VRRQTQANRKRHTATGETANLELCGRRNTSEKRVSLFTRLQVPVLLAARPPLFLFGVLPRRFSSKRETAHGLVSAWNQEIKRVLLII